MQIDTCTNKIVYKPTTLECPAHVIAAAILCEHISNTEIYCLIFNCQLNITASDVIFFFKFVHCWFFELSWSCYIKKKPLKP